MNWLRVSSTGGGVRIRHWEGGSTSCGGSVAFFAVERDELEGRHREVSDSECALGVDIQAVAVAIAQDRTSDCRVCYTRSARTDSNVAANIWQGRGRRRREEVGKRSANAPEQTKAVPERVRVGASFHTTISVLSPLRAPTPHLISPRSSITRHLPRGLCYIRALIND